MKQVHITCMANQYDNNINTQGAVDWLDVVELLCKHKSVSEKTTNMFNGWVFENLEGGEFIRRCEANVTLLTMLILDFDGEMSIAEAKKHFREYEYLAYTSFSHLVSEDKNFAECFRVVLPLHRPMFKKEYDKKFNNIRKWVGNLDSSSTDRSRGFFVPSCLEENLPLARVWFNEGKYLNPDMFEEEPEIVYEKFKPSNIDTDARQVLLDKLRATFVGKEPVWYQVGIALSCEGFDLADFTYVSMGMMKQKTTKDCEKKWKTIQQLINNGKSMNVGYLINVIKGKHN